MIAFPPDFGFPNSFPPKGSVTFFTYFPLHLWEFRNWGSMKAGKGACNLALAAHLQGLFNTLLLMVMLRLLMVEICVYSYNWWSRCVSVPMTSQTFVFEMKDHLEEQPRGLTSGSISAGLGWDLIFCISEEFSGEDQHGSWSTDHTLSSQEPGPLPGLSDFIFITNSGRYSFTQRPLRCRD